MQQIGQSDIRAEFSDQRRPGCLKNRYCPCFGQAMAGCYTTDLRKSPVNNDQESLFGFMK